MQNTYFALEKFNLMFSDQEVEEFIYLWNHGHSLQGITRFLKKYNKGRTFNEVCLLTFDLFANEMIGRRANGLDECFDMEVAN